LLVEKPEGNGREITGDERTEKLKAGKWVPGRGCKMEGSKTTTRTVTRSVGRKGAGRGPSEGRRIIES